MAAKGVNLLPEDDDGQDNNESEDEYEDDLDEEYPSRSRRSRGGGGGFLRVVGILFAVTFLLSGAAWAGYQFWWIPRLEKEQKKIEARKRLEDLRISRLAQAKAERERRKKELALLQKMRGETEKRANGKSEKSDGIQRMNLGIAGKAPKEMVKPADGFMKSVASGKMPEPVVEKNQPRVAKEIPQNKMAMGNSPDSSRKISLKRTKVSKVAPQAPVELSKPNEPSKPVITTTKTVPRPRKGKVEKEKSAMLKPASTLRVPRARGRFYSVQVATCRTNRCVNSFVRKLKVKGFPSFVSKRIYASVPWTEVLLDEFASKGAALSLAAIAREKRVRVTVYQKGKIWRVSAGSFANIEDAAQRLDQVEDFGLKAKLAAGSGSRKPGFRTVRTGRLTSRKFAAAMRKRIVAAGFQDSFVVLRKLQK